MTVREASPRRVHVRTYGCQMNVYDSERMTDLLAADGYTAVDNPAEADLILLNTCHIREKAADKIYSDLGRLRALKEDAANAGRRMTIGVAGCVAQAEGKEIIRRAPVVDLVVGPQSYDRLAELVRKSSARPVVETEFAIDAEVCRTRRNAAPRGPRRQCVSHRAGRLRQVLHLLRRALHARRRGLASGGGDHRRGGAACGAGCARGDASWAERERVAWRRRGRPRREDLAICFSVSRKCRDSTACATRRAIRATWTMR